MSGPANVVGKERDRGEGEDTIRKKQQELQEQSLVPIKEDLCDWVSRLLGIEVMSETFIETLDSGVVLCRLAQLIQAKAEECQREGKLSEPLPATKIRCNAKAKSGTWFARDNSANFLAWCRDYGIREESLFEGEDLVTYKREKPVINTLLELARLAWRFGIEPPSLIKMEKEIDLEEETLEMEDLKEVEIVSPVEEKPVTVTPPVSARPATASKKKTLDAEVRRVAAKCRCQKQVIRIREGVYRVFGKVVFIRLLQEKHLMVRVGGGWTTFEAYLIHHDPSHIQEVSRTPSREDLLDEVGKYLVAKGSYKSSG